jgi:hypothetical protein
MELLEMKIRRIAPVCLCAFTLSCCASLVEMTGRALDGSAFGEEELALYRLPWAPGYTGDGEEEPDREKSGSLEVRRLRDKNGGESLAIFPGTLPGLRINASLPDAEGNFYFMSLDFFCSNLMGWNEFTLELSGGGSFREKEGGALLAAGVPVEMAGISKGRLRRQETRLTGEEALRALRNRQERITALCAWMRAQKDAPPFRNEAEFEAWWEPVLLPEMVSSSRRPAAWTEENAEWLRAEDIAWNTAYTKAVFSEDLWKVRDSGTLLRDWEETLDWIYFIYEWDDLFDFLSRELYLEGVQ